MSFLKILVLVPAALTGLTAPIATASAAPATTRTVVYGFGGGCPPTGWANPAMRPSLAMFNLACEDGIRHIRWHDWRRLSASGHGTHLQFNGTGFTGQAATISLSAVRSHNGRHYFSHLVIRWTTRNGQHHHEALNWKRVNRAWIWA
jgi:hypothetical protein